MFFFGILWACLNDSPHHALSWLGLYGHPTPKASWLLGTPPGTYSGWAVVRDSGNNNIFTHKCSIGCIWYVLVNVYLHLNDLCGKCRYLFGAHTYKYFERLILLRSMYCCISPTSFINKYVWPSRWWGGGSMNWTTTCPNRSDNSSNKRLRKMGSNWWRSTRTVKESLECGGLTGFRCPKKTAWPVKTSSPSSLRIHSNETSRKVTIKSSLKLRVIFYYSNFITTIVATS